MFKDFIEATTEKAVRAIRIRTKGYTLAELKELPKQPLMVKFIGRKVRYFAPKDSILVGGNIAALTDAEFQQTPTFPEKSIQLLKPIDSLSTSFVTRIAVGKKLISSKEEFNATLDCSLSYKLDNFTPQQGAGALIFQSTSCELSDANPSIMAETGIAKGIVRNTERFLANGKLNLVFQGYTEEEVKTNLLSSPQDIQLVYTGTDTKFIVKSSSFLVGLSSFIQTTN
ncbi:hypothetical protein [Glaciecola sp. 1036]|uniref:hypothetical protein n=1 Tax=Alteromonadaceae TaxID=72275 RepID=UPI003CFE6DB7